MTNIDKDLISNKPSCYVFDIDGVLADVRDILLTKKQAYELYAKQYQEKIEVYNKQLMDYEAQRKLYKRNDEVFADLVEPIRPATPVKPLPNEEDKIDWDYFKDHMIEAHPIQGVLDLFTSIASSHKVVLLTGRMERHRAATIEWLKKVIIEKGGNDLFRRINFQLIMRSEKEMKDPSPKYKRNRLLEISKQYNIQVVLEDCPEIIAELTKMGLLVLTPNREYYRVGQE